MLQLQPMPAVGWPMMQQALIHGLQNLKYRVWGSSFHTQARTPGPAYGAGALSGTMVLDWNTEHILSCVHVQGMVLEAYSFHRPTWGPRFLSGSLASYQGFTYWLGVDSKQYSKLWLLRMFT